MPQILDPQRIAPARGVEVPAEDRATLSAGVRRLETRIVALRPQVDAERLADVTIYLNAVQYALEQDIFFEVEDIEIAALLLEQGNERVAHLEATESPWTTAPGCVARGYVSRLDGSVQPYGLVVPASYDPQSGRRHRLDIWHHGRNNRLSELRFLNTAQTKPGEFTPPDTFVLHTYGRYCNAMKFAGEVDTFEALAHARQNYPIDEDRINVRGFSMGGAAAWHMAVHHAGMWCTATPGAGFAETPVYQNAFAQDPKPTWWEQKLWHLYDATDWAANLHQCPVIAYSGEADKQMQAADIMADAMKREGLDLVHIIGTGMGHRFDEVSRVEIERRLSARATKGRERVPRSVHFTTYTLRYNEMNWIRVDALDQHWERARVDAEISGSSSLTINTTNVSALTLTMPADLCPLRNGARRVIRIDGDAVEGSSVPLKGTWSTHLQKVGDRWEVKRSARSAALRKTHGLQGPIDDAFLGSFLMVTPSHEPLLNPSVTAWIADEFADAAYQWKMQFRGRPRVAPDRTITPDDIASHNLVLWGDPRSNAVIRRISQDLPIRWDAEAITVGKRHFSADACRPVLVYPNPLNHKRYVVLNSGFTFAQAGAQSNAQQTPKLPDWAVLDIRVPRGERIPNGVADCGFFDEAWQLM